MVHNGEGNDHQDKDDKCRGQISKAFRQFSHFNPSLSYPTVMPLLNGRSFSPFNPTYDPFDALKTIFSFTIAL